MSQLRSELTQKFSATLATIADAAKRGELSSEQAREISSEQYQIIHMQFELLSLWRFEIEVRVRKGDGNYRWFMARFSSVPTLRDATRLPCLVKLHERYAFVDLGFDQVEFC